MTCPLVKSVLIPEPGLGPLRTDTQPVERPPAALPHLPSGSPRRRKGHATPEGPHVGWALSECGCFLL